MVFESFLQNLSIFNENLSIFYIFCTLVSFLAVWLTWKIEPKHINIEAKEESTEDSLSNEHLLSADSDELIQSNITNPLDRKDLIKSIEKSLTSDDRAKENEIEKQQLKDILNVMKKDDKFSSTTMEELEEQLKLYRD